MQPETQIAATLRAEWSADRELRAEFHDNMADYLGFVAGVMSGGIKHQRLPARLESALMALAQ